MNSHDFSRTGSGITVLDRLGDNFDVVLAAIDEREAQRRTFTLPRIGGFRLAGAFAAAVAVVAVAVLTYSVLTGGNALTTEQAIAEVAHAASVQTLPPDDAYTYTRARTVETKFSAGAPPASGTPARPLPYFVTSERQSWLSVAREGLIEIHRLKVDARFGTPPVTGRSFVRIPYPALGSYQLGEGHYTRAEIEQYPTDPHTIYNRLSSELAGANSADKTFAIWNALTSALTSAVAPLPPDLRAGIVTAIGYIPGIHSDGTIKDPRGNEGAGFTLNEKGLQLKIIFDENTSAVLFDQTKITGQQESQFTGVPVNSVYSQYQLLAQSQTNEIPPR